MPPMKRPTKITPDPIIEAVVELRYESDVPPDAILGMLFPYVKLKYPDFKKLPIATIPEEIRMNDPNLQFSPYHQSQHGSFKLNVGPRVISLSNTGQYVGWKNNYFPEIIELLESVKAAGIVKHFSRLGVRYIDFFESNIFENINLSILLNKNPLDSLQTTFSAILKTNGFLTKTQVVNNVNLNIQGFNKVGSIIDTDTYFEQDKFGFEGLNDLINNGHEEAVGVFFSLLKPAFLKTLAPEYHK